MFSKMFTVKAIKPMVFAFQPMVVCFFCLGVVQYKQIIVLVFF